jgi:hypothetical protein
VLIGALVDEKVGAVGQFPSIEHTWTLNTEQLYLSIKTWQFVYGVVLC